MFAFAQPIEMENASSSDYPRNLKLTPMIVEDNSPIRMVNSNTFKDFVSDL